MLIQILYVLIYTAYEIMELIMNPRCEGAKIRPKTINRLINEEKI